MRCQERGSGGPFSPLRHLIANISKTVSRTDTCQLDRTFLKCIAWVIVPECRTCPHRTYNPGQFPLPFYIV